MKKGIIAVLAVTTVFFVSSCGKKGGLSEETKTEMQKFETDWKTAEASMMAFETTMTTKFEGMNKMMAETEAMDMSKMKPAEKEACDVAMAQCAVIKTSMDKMKADFTTAMGQWKTDSDAYQAWKKKAQEEKLDDATFKSELENNWMSKVATWNETMSGWNESLTGMESACKAQCDAMMMMPGMDMKGMEHHM